MAQCNLIGPLLNRLLICVAGCLSMLFLNFTVMPRKLQLTARKKYSSFSSTSESTPSTDDSVANGIVLLGLRLTAAVWLSQWNCKLDQEKDTEKCTQSPRKCRLSQ